MYSPLEALFLKNWIYNMEILLKNIKYALRSDWEAYHLALDKTLESNNEIVREVSAQILSKRGKEMRPLLVLLGANMCDSITEKTIQTAVAFELLHMSSLIHDDVVDNADKRHNQPSVRALWNNKLAVLVGDYFVAKSIQVVSNIRNKKISDTFIHTAQQLADGEILEMHPDKMWISEEEYFNIINLKTAQLFSGCCQSAAFSTKNTNSQMVALRKFGYHFGICFQLCDDLLDFSDNEQLGKPTMIDLKDNKPTLAILKTYERATATEKQEIKHLVENLSQDKTAEQEIKSFIARYDGIGYVHQCMQKHQASALECLNGFEDCQAKEYLKQILSFSAHRNV